VRQKRQKKKPTKSIRKENQQPNPNQKNSDNIHTPRWRTTKSKGPTGRVEWKPKNRKRCCQFSPFQAQTGLPCHFQKLKRPIKMERTTEQKYIKQN